MNETANRYSKLASTAKPPDYNRPSNNTPMTDLLALSPMLILRHIIRKILSTLSKGDVDVIIVGFIILWAVGFDDLFTGVFARCSISYDKLVFVSRKQKNA